MGVQEASQFYEGQLLETTLGRLFLLSVNTIKTFLKVYVSYFTPPILFLLFFLLHFVSTKLRSFFAPERNFSSLVPLHTPFPVVSCSYQPLTPLIPFLLWYFSISHHIIAEGERG